MPKQIAVMPEAILIGVGNILLKDEGVGVYAAKYIAENFLFSPSIDVIDGGTIGYKLINYFQSYSKVFILDTISADDEPGSVYSMPSKALMGMGHYRRTAHEVEVVEMLEICSLTETMAEVNIIGIVPEDTKSVGIDLTDKLKSHFDAFVGTAINELKKADFKARHKRNKKSLGAIIRSYNLPHAQRLVTRGEISEQLI